MEDCRRHFSAVLQSLYAGHLHKLSAAENPANDGKSTPWRTQLPPSSETCQLCLAPRHKPFLSLLLIVNPIKIRKLGKPKRPNSSQIKKSFRGSIVIPSSQHVTQGAGNS